MRSRSRMRYLGASRSAKVSTICWEVQSAVGCSVTLKCSTCRRRCFQHEEHEQHPHGDRGHCKEIDRHHLADVVAKKSLPGLAGSPRQLSEDSRDGSLRDLDAKHLEFSVNPWRTPQRIGRDHPLDQSANLDGSRGYATVPAPRQPRPELAKTLPLPPDDGVGLYVQQRAAPVAPNPRQTDPEQPIERGQHWSFALSPKGSEL